jgi:putative cell wall-binding protein
MQGWVVGVDAWRSASKTADVPVVARTTDGGTTWTLPNEIPPSSETLRAVSFADATTGVAVGTGGTVFRTSDGGARWTDGVSNVVTQLNGVAMQPGTDDGWAVGDGGVIRKTSDGGATWTQFPSGTSAHLTAIAHVSGTTFVVVGSGGVTITVSASTQVVLVPIEGPNRFATAIEISKKAFPAGSEYVIIATGMNWPDALGGSALAGALDAPILLTRQDVLPTEVRDEIVRLKGTKASITAIVLGGTPAVSAAVFSEIDAIAGVTMEPRLFGPNRYATANAVAARTIEEMQKKPGGYDGTAFVATGANFPDALGASPLAAKKGWPIYLSNPALGSNTALVATMKAVEVTDAILLGGANVVSDLIRAELGPTYETRLYGPNRYDTAVAVASYGVANAGLSWDRLAIATGENFPDALAGGVLQGKDGSVLLLTPTLSLNANVAAKLSANKASITEVRFLGSTAAVSQAVRNAVVAALQ